MPRRVFSRSINRSLTSLAKVVLKGITKRFGDVVAVNDLSLDIADKEFVVFLGPSGCGKTTSLRIIAGLENPEEGEVYIGDRMVNDLEPKERNVAMVFQNYALYPHMTVYKNMAFPLQNFGYGPSQIYKRIKEVARMLQIEPLLERKPTALSGGQQQRVALGRAIVRQPEVFLMDEPLSNLDAKLRVYMRAELKQLQKELGVTTIYVTHDQVEAMTMGDKIVLMNQGLLQQVDPPQQIYSKPDNQFVAGFVGSPPINFFDTTLLPDGSLDAGEFLYPLSEDLSNAARGASSEEIILAVRPQEVQVYKTDSGDDSLIPAHLDTIEPLGDLTILDMSIGDSILKASVSSGFDPGGAEKLWVRFPVDKIYLFDKKSGTVLT